MCLIAFAWNVHPHWPLMLVANRDEYHARPTAGLAPWTAAPQIIGGRDLRAGGGWLALNRAQGRLAAVTNVREPAAPHADLRSRGALVGGFVQAGECAASFAEHLMADAPSYGPFNLLLWDKSELIYAGNRPSPRWESLTAGVHGLSNGALESHWPKTQRLIEALSGWLPQLPSTGKLPSAESIEPLLQALADDRAASDAELPDTGVGRETERRLSPPFIRGAAYGTRASSVVLIARSGAVLFVERRFGPNGIELGFDALEFPG
jgi:uncharacterized protein with NRDE domain